VTQGHQRVVKITKTIFLTSINFDESSLLYSYIRDLQDSVIRRILINIDIDRFEIQESFDHMHLPEIYAVNSPDNAIILEWWLFEAVDPFEIIDDFAPENIKRNQQIEYRFSHYQRGDGLSRIIDRGMLLSEDLPGKWKEEERVIINLVDFLQQYHFT